MDLQKSLSVCLLTFFFATIVVLIAKAMDNQAASRLEPQLTRIADQLEALTASGGFPVASSTAVTSAEKPDRVVVNYFYSTTRCTTCRAIESQTSEVVQSQYAAELQDGTITWKTLNYEDDRSGLMEKFEIVMPVVVLTRFEDDEMADWKRLDQVWGIVNDKPAFASFIHDEIDAMLSEVYQSKSIARTQSQPVEDDTPIDSEEPSPADLPLPE
ncbi:nitrophenyl compound nitroreductase subunit ArsF family protein [Aporhodopirellula aestuarii]|uniref:Nitrophenyl compound nitroreductase subunit ArsF family protein n=1 Tax=Aporhodopirellula aestuarii TaxID=2950107 RepID=A0ABT0UA96_9BACT|nr:nitrophenyl compound nitroreductase subunit ArsF family protein [Aporhodopirellula aestuarii]MCM2373614.1 nitrophenyl compound nitroreductase subunit ArsF family protein [Aporhodopirellula aestuarii]